jgi:hypothetical protein
MFFHTPAAVGLPLIDPVLVSNTAQPGREAMWKHPLHPLPYFTPGVNAYVWPTLTTVEGVPVKVIAPAWDVNRIVRKSSPARVLPPAFDINIKHLQTWTISVMARSGAPWTM